MAGAVPVLEEGPAACFRGLLGPPLAPGLSLGLSWPALPPSLWGSLVASTGTWEQSPGGPQGSGQGWDPRWVQASASAQLCGV